MQKNFGNFDEGEAGKSTFINALINFIMNIKYDDKYRFKIVNENNNNKKCSSQQKKLIFII